MIGRAYPLTQTGKEKNKNPRKLKQSLQYARIS